MNKFLNAFLSVFLFSTVASAAEEPSIKKGHELFNSTAIASNGKSCASCHPGGKGMEEAATYDDKELAKISNQCLVKALQGKALADGSLELNSLVMYLKTLGAVKAK